MEVCCRLGTQRWHPSHLIRVLLIPCSPSTPRVLVAAMVMVSMGLIRAGALPQRIDANKCSSRRLTSERLVAALVAVYQRSIFASTGRDKYGSWGVWTSTFGSPCAEQQRFSSQFGVWTAVPPHYKTLRNCIGQQGCMRVVGL